MEVYEICGRSSLASLRLRLDSPHATANPSASRNSAAPPTRDATGNREARESDAIGLVIEGLETTCAEHHQAPLPATVEMIPSGVTLRTTKFSESAM